MARETGPMRNEYSPLPVHTGGVEGLYRELVAVNPNGYRVSTDHTLSIREGRWGRSEPLPLTTEERKLIAAGMREEVTRARRLAGTTQAVIVRDYLRRNPLQNQGYSPEQEAMAELSRESLRMLDENRYGELRTLEKTRKTGYALRGERRHGNRVELVGDAYPVPYAMYQHLGLPEAHARTKGLGNLLATGVGLITDDGILVLQYRDPELNRIYGGMLGTSTGGLYDSRFNPNKRGSVKEVTTESILANAADELDWEIGLPRDHVDMKIVGLIRDLGSIHDEAIIYATTDWTFDQLKANALVQARRQSPRPGHEFAEDICGIKATPRNAEILFGETLAPFPRTHVGSLLIPLYIHTHQSPTWKLQLEQLIAQNYRNINTHANEYWRSHPDELTHYQGDPKVYDHRFPADIQGFSNPLITLSAKGVEVYR